MSILIKGIDKPTDCGVCPFGDFGYCNVKGERNTSESGIDDDCPLVEIPTPHGRLIDIDDIMARHTDWEQGTTTVPTLYELIYAPSVIEAEGE